MNYNFFTWWLSTKIKPLPYKIWKYIIYPIMFIGWAACIGAFPHMYWKFSLFVLLPTAVIDISWDAINFYFYRKKLAKNRIDDLEEPVENDINSSENNQ